MAAIEVRTGFSPPLRDLMGDGVYERLSGGLRWGRILGIAMVAGRRCQHLVFGQEAADWQLWIDTEEDLPRKLVLTYRELPLAPQFSIVIHEWDLDARPADEDFDFTPPSDGMRVRLVPSDLGGLTAGSSR